MLSIFPLLLWATIIYFLVQIFKTNLPTKLIFGVFFGLISLNIFANVFLGFWLDPFLNQIIEGVDSRIEMSSSYFILFKLISLILIPLIFLVIEVFTLRKIKHK